MQKQKKSKAKDTRPARDRYWKKHTLRTRKVRRLAANLGVSIGEAFELWMNPTSPYGRRGRMRS